jgi:hypothetical protein
VTLIPVQVHCGGYVGFDDVTPASGEITFTPLDGWIRSALVPAEYAPLPISAPINSGNATVTLLAPTETTDPSIVYSVTVAIPQLVADTFVIRMPVNPALDNPLELASRDNNQGVLDPQGAGGSSDGGFGTSDGGFGGGTDSGPPIDASAAELGALYGLLYVLDE